MTLKQVCRPVNIITLGGYTKTACKMPNDAFLTAIEAKILVSLARSKDNVLITESILKETRISGSTWAEEQNKLIAIGLIDKKPVRVMSRGNVSRVMSYKLTDKGKLVAVNLLNISRILSTGLNASPAAKDGDASMMSFDQVHSSSVSTEHVGDSIDGRIKESIEIGLDSFGVNLEKLVRETVEAEIGVSWERIAQAPEQLMVVLRDLFGPEGANTIESMIAANIRHDLGLTSITTDRLTLLIPEAKRQLERQSQYLRRRVLDESVQSSVSSEDLMLP